MCRLTNSMVPSDEKSSNEKKPASDFAAKTKIGKRGVGHTGYSSEVNDPIRNSPRPGRRFVVELQFFSLKVVRKFLAEAG